MSARNVAALKDLYERWGAGDWRDVSIFDPYAVCVLPDPTPRPQYGMAATREYMRRLLEGWEDIRIEALRYEEAEGTVIVWVRRIGRGAGSGIEIEDHSMHLWTFRGDKVVRFEVVEEEADALAMVGRRGPSG